MIKDAYKIGLIGLGSIAVSHIEAIGRIRNFRLAAVCDSDASRLKEMSQQTGAAAFSDYRNMLDSADVDMVVIALPHYLHAPVAIEAMNRKLHVLVEKPVAITEKELCAMERAAAGNGVVLLGADVAYFDRRFETAQRLISEIDTGRFLFGTCINHRNYLSLARPAWFLDESKSGGGQFLNIGVHRVAATRRILGDFRKIAEVTANMQAIDGAKVESATQMLVRYDDGATFFYEECGLPAASPEFNQRLHLVFGKGTLMVNCSEVAFHDSHGNVVSEIAEKQLPHEMYCGIYENFLLALQGENVYPDFSHNAADVRVIFKAVKSCRKNISSNKQSKTMPRLMQDAAIG